MADTVRYSDVERDTLSRFITNNRLNEDRREDGTLVYTTDAGEVVATATYNEFTKQFTLDTNNGQMQNYMDSKVELRKQSPITLDQYEKFLEDTELKSTTMSLRDWNKKGRLVISLEDKDGNLVGTASVYRGEVTIETESKNAQEYFQGRTFELPRDTLSRFITNNRLNEDRWEDGTLVYTTDAGEVVATATYSEDTKTFTVNAQTDDVKKYFDSRTPLREYAPITLDQYEKFLEDTELKSTTMSLRDWNKKGRLVISLEDKDGNLVGTASVYRGEVTIETESKNAQVYFIRNNVRGEEVAKIDAPPPIEPIQRGIVREAPVGTKEGKKAKA